MLIPKADDLSPPFNEQEGDISTWQFVAGECQIEDYQNLILLESVGWSTSATVRNASDGRRSLDSPKVSSISIHRRIDLSSAYLTWAAVTSAVGEYPWQIYFLKGLDDSDGTGSNMQSLFLTVIIVDPVVTSYTFNSTEGEGEEDIEINATAIIWNYQQIDEDQNIEGQREITWDMSQGEIC